MGRAIKWMNFLLLFLSMVSGSLSAQIWAQDIIRVGLLDLNDIPSFRCQSALGSHEWMLPNGQVLGPLDGMPTITSQAGSFQINSGEFSGHTPYVILRPKTHDARLRIVTEALGYRQYPGAIHFIHVRGTPRLIMESAMENYLPGVLAAEVGKGHAMPFYEAHAVISRSYAVQSIDRHRMDGYDLCDQVHCQVFKGTSTVNDTLHLACQATRSLVLIDRIGRVATAAFHSNCGGQTRNGHDVWNGQMPYLQSIEDTTCSNAPHARWQRTVPRQEWDEFWSVHAVDSIQGILNARHKFHWPSASFKITYDPSIPDVYQVDGRGFGHGVGLCQEGAMQRALTGSSAWEILQNYYTGVRLLRFSHP